MPMRTPARTIDEYLAPLGDDQRAALERLRRDIHAAVPGLEECISYQMPGFRLDGRVIVWFGAAKNHCSFFPGAVIEELADELAGFSTSKGTVRFQPDHPLPASLVKRLVRARLARIPPKQRRSAAKR